MDYRLRGEDGPRRRYGTTGIGESSTSGTGLEAGGVDLQRQTSAARTRASGTGPGPGVTRMAPPATDQWYLQGCTEHFSGLEAQLHNTHRLACWRLLAGPGVVVSVHDCDWQNQGVRVVGLADPGITTPLLHRSVAPLAPAEGCWAPDRD